MPLLQKQMQDYAEQTISVRKKLEIRRNTVEIWIDDRLEDKFREGRPDKRPVASTASGLTWIIILVVIVVAAFAIMTKHH